MSGTDASHGSLHALVLSLHTQYQAQIEELGSQHAQMAELIQQLVHQTSTPNTPTILKNAHQVSHLHKQLQRLSTQFSSQLKNTSRKLRLQLKEFNTNRQRDNSSTNRHRRKILLMQQPARIVSLPQEVLVQVLSWVHPRDAFRLRTLSHRFFETYKTRHFHVSNLSKFIAPRSLSTNKDCKKLLVDACDVLTFRAASSSTQITTLSAFAVVYAESVLARYTHIIWPQKMQQLTGLKIPHFLGMPNSRLIHLDMSYCLLTGEIPSELQNLRSLKVLNLEGNRLTGNISGHLFGNFEDLQELNLSWNAGISGVIPDELYTHCPKLQIVKLHCCALNGSFLEDRIGCWTDLRELWLNGNKFKGVLTVGTGLVGLVNLQVLYLRNNRELFWESHEVYQQVCTRLVNLRERDVHRVVVSS
ncbi:hypothetical protein CcCBS67573_g04086 [Chytriomyces confervae]|uniref:F-box domain-containing protein n=1 Tax=Chytriomyces confervae TaxID=246404 RepID=A0A507FH86_9FUNG|nr:hypothetical protein CcCBS67573_g04086 [Chytriomyces confervae]